MLSSFLAGGLPAVALDGTFTSVGSDTGFMVAIDGPINQTADLAADRTADLAAELKSAEPIVIDNDEEDAVVAEEFPVKQVTDVNGNQLISTGARFPVSLVTTHNSKTARVGDTVEARLKHDLRLAGKLIAPRGSRVTGHVTMSAKARRILAAELSAKRWMRANGAVGVQFDEIINEEGEHLPLVAAPARSARIVKNVNEGRVLGVNHNGEVAAPLSTQLKHQAAHLAIRGAASTAGVFSFGIVPLAYGVVGAMNPSFAFLHPVGKNVRHRRLKGFAMGIVAGLPGGFLIADSIIKGQEAVIKPGDEFLVEFKQNFTGEPATDAELVNGATTRVQGQVVPQGKKKK